MSHYTDWTAPEAQQEVESTLQQSRYKTKSPICTRQARILMRERGLPNNIVEIEVPDSAPTPTAADAGGGGDDAGAVTSGATVAGGGAGGGAGAGADSGAGAGAAVGAGGGAGADDG